MKIFITLSLLILLFFSLFHDVAITKNGLYLDVRGFAYEAISKIENNFVQVDCNE